MVMKKITLLIIFLCAISLGYGQTMLAQFNFETPGGYITSETEFTNYVFPTTGSDGRDYFLRTDGSNIRAENFTNTQGFYYFAAQDIDGGGATLPVSTLIDNINISGYTSLEFRVHLAEDDAGDGKEDWDNGDYVHFSYDIDNSGSPSNLLWIENDGGGTNGEPSIDADFNGVGDGVSIITDTFTQYTQSIAGTGSLIDIEIEFQLNAGDEDIAIDNIEIWGTLIPCAASATWNGTNWVGGTPDLTTDVTIDGHYNTSANGSFSACCLTVNSTYNLTVDDGDYVEVQNDVTVDGQLFVETQGNFIQKNDAASFVDNSITPNGVLLNKTKTIANKFVYTYWSSPVTSETVENVFSTVPVDKRFSFNAANFEDLLEEIGSSNPPVFISNPGVDDIDDNGDDWEYASGALTPGVGYAMRTNEFGPVFPRPETYVFRGEFNNGEVTVPLVNNSGGIYNDWNLIGNPYPCAIDADQFFLVNAGIVDAIYLWNQFTAPSSTASGNEGYNFSGADYAIINGSGAVSNGSSGAIPNRFVPSGQGFFVEALSASNVIFNNSMRLITNDNSQFFKGKSSKNKTTENKNKLWVNLNSDNGAANQMLVSYVDGASSSNDGSFYDLKRPVSTGNKALLYSLIENDNGKFAIQGKAPSDLNENETISLGFKTIIDVATLYTLSIAQMQGDFINSNTVYLKDNLLNKTHNLSDSDYTFTSEVGEFNGRFQIVFNNNALSTDDTDLYKNKLSIIELEDNKVNFKTANNLSIKTVSIYDLLGRQLYNFKGNSASETYELSNLKSTIYVAKVELSNATTITKKAIKR